MERAIAAATVIMVAGLAFGQTIPTEGLVAHWNFDDNVLDQSGNGLDGTFYGGSPSYVDGVAGRALSFDGVDDVVVTDDVFSGYDGSQGFSGVIWFKVSSAILNTSATIWERDYCNFDLYLAEGDKGLHTRTSRIDTNMTTKCPIQPCQQQPMGCIFPDNGVWYQAAAVYDPSLLSIRLYIDGELEGVTGIPVFTSFRHTSSNLRFGIGARPSQDWFFHGAVDELIVYNRPLTVQEIADLYNSTSTQAKRGFPRVERAPGLSLLCSAEGVAIRADRDMTLTFVRPNGTSTGPLSLTSGGTHLVRKGLASGAYIVKYQCDNMSSVKRVVMP